MNLFENLCKLNEGGIDAVSNTYIDNDGNESPIPNQEAAYVLQFNNGQYYNGWSDGQYADLKNDIDYAQMFNSPEEIEQLINKFLDHNIENEIYYGDQSDIFEYDNIRNEISNGYKIVNVLYKDGNLTVNDF